MGAHIQPNYVWVRSAERHYSSCWPVTFFLAAYLHNSYLASQVTFFRPDTAFQLNRMTYLKHIEQHFPKSTFYLVNMYQRDTSLDNCAAYNYCICTSAPLLVIFWYNTSFYETFFVSFQAIHPNAEHLESIDIGYFLLAAAMMSDGIDTIPTLCQRIVGRPCSGQTCQDIFSPFYSQPGSARTPPPYTISGNPEYLSFGAAWSQISQTTSFH